MSKPKYKVEVVDRYSFEEWFDVRVDDEDVYSVCRTIEPFTQKVEHQIFDQDGNLPTFEDQLIELILNTVENDRK